MNNKTGISLRRLSFKFKVSFKTISNQLKAMGIYYHKKKRAPRYSNKQLEEIPTRARRLYRLLSKNDFQLIMDDEKYFMLHDEFVPSNRGFYTSNPSDASPGVKFRRAQKFELSKNFSLDSRAKNFSLEARLMPFIHKHHIKEKVLFWPDLATSHYSHKVMNYLDDNEVQMVHKQWSP